MRQSFTLWLWLVLLAAACAPAATPQLTSVPTEETQQRAAATPLPAEPPPAGAEQEFKTDFTRHSIPYSEILSGGPPKDGIPAIDDPRFVTVSEADAWLKPIEPVILLEINGATRAYPIQILMWHEIVSDTIGGVPVAVTFCPLCNTAIVFDRRIDERVLDFGTTGRLRYSNLIMYDRQTESWWQQAGGDAIAGELTGQQLKFVPASIIAWADFKANFPDGQVLSRETGFDRSYGRNPYLGYDDVNQPPFLYRGPPTPDRLPPIARVLTIDLDGEAVAYPYEMLQEKRVINDSVGGKDVVVLWREGTASALDQSTVAGGRDVGTANAYSRQLDGRTLTFASTGEQITDRETGSTWDVLGRAIAGPLAGQVLTPVVAINHFWFSWAAFKPQTHIYQP
jgi:hypothetical protein